MENVEDNPLKQSDFFFQLVGLNVKEYYKYLL